MPFTGYKLSRASRLVLYYLTDHAKLNADGERDIVVSRKVLREHAKTTERHVERCLRRLEALGYITTHLQVNPLGDYGSSRYVVHPITAPFAERLIKQLYDQKGIPLTPPELAPTIKTRPE
jgi:hypothetical protein